MKLLAYLFGPSLSGKTVEEMRLWNDNSVELASKDDKEWDVEIIEISSRRRNVTSGIPMLVFISIFTMFLENMNAMIL